MAEKDRNLEEGKNEFEEPVLLEAEDLEDVDGGCAFNCSDGSCMPFGENNLQ